MHRSLVAIAIAALTTVALSSTDARAQAPGEAAPRATPGTPIVLTPTPVDVVTKHYGWQVILADAAVLTAAVGLERGDLLLGWSVSGSAVHGAHGNWGRAGLSLGLRLGLPLLGGVVGNHLMPGGCSGDVCRGEVGAVLGALTGFGTALILDWTVVARERHFVPRRRPGLLGSMTPTAAVDKTGVQLGLSGQF